MDNDRLCISCKEKFIFNKKMKLCKVCYEHAMYIKRQSIGIRYITEIEFVKNYFHHQNWLHESVSFRINGKLYTPDFYDGERNVFIEVAGTRQAYHANKEKYAAFKKTFPQLNFEVRLPSGKILDEEAMRLHWAGIELASEE